MEVINIDDSDDDDDIGHSSLSTPAGGAEVPEGNNQEDHDDYEYRVMLLMDHREFGLRKNDAKAHQNQLKEFERQINNVFNGTYCEIVALKSADYQFVVRKISKATGQVVDTRLLELIIERKDVGDLASCLINESKTHAPLSSFQAQMYKLINCGIKRKIFLMEGNEDNFKWRTEGGKPPSEEEIDKRKKRVKTTRMLVEAGRFRGIQLICTRFPDHTRKFLTHQMKLFMESFDPRDFSSMKTMEQFKDHVNKQMKDPTFLKYIALRRKKGTGDITAMKIIKENGPDKSFVSPCLKHDDIKSNGDEKPTFWDSRTATTQPAAASSSRSERSASVSSQAPAAANESNVSTANRSNSSLSVAAASSGSSNPYSSSAGGATASFPYSTNSARANQKSTGEKSQTKKRSAPKQTPYKKRQKPSEKVYVRQNPSHSKSSSSTPKESFNGYMTANPLHESRNSSLVAALLNDDESMNTKPKAKDASVRREASANLSGAKSAGAEKFNYMLEFDEDDIEGQVVAVPVTQNTKSDLEDEAPTRDENQKKDADSKYASKSSSWYDEYKDVLESSSDDDSVSSAEMGNKYDGTKATNKNDVIVIDDDGDDDGSVGSVIILD